MVSLLLATATSATESDLRLAGSWNQFHGPNQSGALEVDAIPTSWTPRSHVAWKAEVEGAGNSSPVVWENKLFITSAITSGGRPEETFVAALDQHTGKQLWRTKVPILSLPGKVPSPENGWATPTPACNSQRVVVVFATGTLACLDHGGQLLWTHDLGPLAHLWGLAASPVMDAGRVFYAVDQGSLCPHPSYLIALDGASGRTVWRTKLAPSIGRGYSTPLLVKRHTRTELVLWAQSNLTGYEIDTGKQIWQVKTFQEKEPIATPVLAGDTLYLGQSDHALALRIPSDTDEPPAQPLWNVTQSQGANLARISGSIVYRGRLYGVSNEGIASCYDAPTAAKIWSGDLNDRFYAAPVATAGHLIFASRKGTFYVLKAGDTFELVATNPLSEPCDVSPSVAEGHLYLRTKLGANQTTLWCIAK